MASESEYRTGLFALGIELDGAGHPADWQARVHAAENAGFTFATIGDSLDPPPGPSEVRLDAGVRAGFVAATTSTLGLVPALAPTYAEPFHLSSQLATLDYATRGRAGWLAIDDPGTARAWGATPRVTESEIRRERVDAIEVARRLWDSWEDDAVVRDYAAGKFLNREKLHHIDFIGETFSVKGPAIVPRPPQGQVVVFGYGTTESEGIDVALVGGATPSEIRTTIDNARAAGIPRVLVDLEIGLDGSGAAADLVARLTELAAVADGARLRPTAVDADLPILARYVLPALLRAGLAHRPVPGSTLRANLGLPRPVNRYAKELAR
ncbi:LLM class flavin-dependent oxidoreductase [Nocardia sp. CDC160]|uniref:LLM class flavin-dependent oxidoreductase n=1 Tax=Nocardia sp. CDC160 TaxID=3112166 RepID=UPI002DB7959D|nr:LLM class flavin-dependent oxidoreductase [Nocardia sp. CDC160]MEC3916881.1 LLM class flavin-dependent oxidoreductase [Nocardia sp. CDC160]